jgi:hypothetical protein
MTDLDFIREDLGPEATDDIVSLAARLRDARPLPSAAFRGELGRRLASQPPRLALGRLRLLIATYASSGGVLLVLGAIGAAGHGPFA